MSDLENLLHSNSKWSTETLSSRPELFDEIAEQQQPKYLWLGCSDSRVCPTEIFGLKLGEVFVHRNIANLAVQTDLSYLSVLQYAVEVLKVKHILVCGHIGCGGVNAAMDGESHGLIDNWLSNINDVYNKHKVLLESVVSVEKRNYIMYNLNVVEQAMNVATNTSVVEAWSKGQSLTISCLMYDIYTGKVTQIAESVNSSNNIDDFYESSLSYIKSCV